MAQAPRRCAGSLVLAKSGRPLYTPAMHAFLTEAEARGFIHQCTDLAALSDALDAGAVSAYVGYDCTADSLHVGSLVSIMLLRLLQKHGHRPVVLMGGGTTRIGDPSGRDETRLMLTDAQIAENMAGIRKAFSHYLHFGDGPAGAIMVNNADWLDRLGYIEVLREIGPHFTINRMLTMDSVRLRLDRQQPLTFLEFNYMISQSYDFRELYRRENVRLQMGGSDQWGNITAGADLVRRTDAVQVWGLTTPLITTASGAKMGKSAKGAIWLNPDRLSPYEYWQFWRNTEDADVGRFPASVHGIAAGRDRAAGNAWRGGHQRRQEGACHRCHGVAAWRRAGRARRRYGARHVRGFGDGQRAPDPYRAGSVAGRWHSAVSSAGGGGAGAQQCRRAPLDPWRRGARERYGDHRRRPPDYRG